MGGVDPYLPVITDPGNHRGLETEVDNPIDKEVDQFAFTGFIDTLAHVEHTVWRGCRKFMGPRFQDAKGLFDQLHDSRVVFMLDQPGQGPVYITQVFLVDHGQAGHVHHVKKEDNPPIISIYLLGPRLQQRLGNRPILFHDLIVGF